MPRNAQPESPPATTPPSRFALRPSAIFIACVRPPESSRRSSRRSRNRPNRAARRRSHRHRTARRSASARARIVGVASAGSRRARQSRLRIGRQEEVSHILADSGLTMLDGEACEVHGIGIARGERVRRRIRQRRTRAVGRADNQAIRARGRERSAQAGDVAGPVAHGAGRSCCFTTPHSPDGGRRASRDLSLRRLEPAGERPISTRFQVRSSVHGHAHRGRHEGRTKNDVPVYNVSLPLLSRTFPNRPPFLVLEVAVDA